MTKAQGSEEFKKQKKNLTFVFVSGRKEHYEKNLIEAREHYYTLPLYDEHENNINVIEFQENSSALNNLLYLIDRIMNKLLSLPFYMHKLSNKKNYRILKKSDHIFLITESTGFSALPMLKALKIFSSSKAKVHMFVMGLYSKKLKYNKLRFLHNLIINLLVLFLDNLFFLGKGELDNAKKITKKHKKLHFVPFSIDEEFWVSNNKIEIKDKEKIIFVGNDGNRNVDLLIQIAKELSSYEFIFVSNLETVKKVNLDNVTVLGDGWGREGLKDVELKQLYLDSKITILPLKESFQPSGQSVALQSMSLGIPVLISETEGFWDKEQFKDNKDIFFVKDNSIDGWVKRIKEVYEDEDLLEKVSNNSRDIVKNILNLNEFHRTVKNIIKLS